MTKKIFAAAAAAAVIAAALPTAGAVNSVTATPTGNSIYVDGVKVNGAAYKIAGSNYFKLRDIAAMVNGSEKQFEVVWNSANKRIDLTTGTAYTAVGGELALPSAQSKAAVKTSAVVFKDGSSVNYTGYNIDSNNYYKLRDLCKDMNIGVMFDAASKRVDIVTSKGYTEDSTAAATPAAAAITKWNSTMSEFNEEMIQNHGDKDKLLAIAAKYGPTITGKANATTADVISALESMTGAPVDAISFDNKPVSLYWAKQLRKANGENIVEVDPDFVPVTDAMLRQWENEMIDSINAERAKAGLSALAKDDNVMKRAQAWAQHLTIEFRHSTWSEVEEFANSIGVDANSISGGENIVGGCFVEDDPVKTDMEKFMASAGHRATILDKDFTRVGVGFAVAADGRNIFCTQNFA